MRKPVIAVSLALALAAPLAIGCGEGPAERAGERIDGNTSGVKDKLTPDGAAEKAGKKLDRAVDDATE